MSLGSRHGTILANAAGGSINVTLPLAGEKIARVYTVKKTDASANTVTLIPASGDTVDGAGTYVLSAQNDSVTVQSDAGTVWRVIAKVSASGGGGGEANTASNINTSGAGVFVNKSGVDLRFKGIDNGSSKVSVTDDTVNHRILVDVVEANLTLSNLGGSLALGQVPNSLITYAKIQNVTDARLLGRSAGSNGAPQEIQVGSGLLLSSGVLSAAAGSITHVKKASDQAISGSSLVNVTGLSFSVAAATDYFFEFFVAYVSLTTTVGLGLAVTAPASPTMFSYNAEIPNLPDAGGGDWQGQGTASGDQVTAPNVPSGGASLVYIARIQGILSNGANAGTVQLQAANETATNNITIKAASLLRWTQI